MLGGNRRICTTPPEHSRCLGRIVSTIRTNCSFAVEKSSCTTRPETGGEGCSWALANGSARAAETELRQLAHTRFDGPTLLARMGYLICGPGVASRPSLGTIQLVHASSLRTRRPELGLAQGHGSDCGRHASDRHLETVGTWRSSQPAICRVPYHHTRAASRGGRCRLLRRVDLQTVRCRRECGENAGLDRTVRFTKIMGSPTTARPYGSLACLGVMFGPPAGSKNWPGSSRVP
jgi:hypothetical protein